MRTEGEIPFSRTTDGYFEGRPQAAALSALIRAESRESLRATVF